MADNLIYIKQKIVLFLIQTTASLIKILRIKESSAYISKRSEKSRRCNEEALPYIVLSTMSNIDLCRKRSSVFRGRGRIEIKCSFS